MPELTIIHAYRHLYRGLLRAVQYAYPARLVARDQVRRAFRDEKGTLDQEDVKRTVWFLDAAAKERGLEHKILKNLIAVRLERNRQTSWKRVYTEGRKKDKYKDEKAEAFRHYEMTLAMLNKSMGLCLR
ncbi:UPF0593 mitochondrial protein [Paramyrothecium foliicola]|nr:UPF0593 mitochondrial protein [Paramyrothecium foliicola]